MKTPMNLMMFLTVTLTCLSLSACGKKTSESSESNEEMLESAVGAMNAAAESSESDSTDIASAYQPTLLEKTLISRAYAGTCGLNRFAPALGSANCGGGTLVTSTFDCTAGRRDEFTINGVVKLDFDSAATCDDWISGGGLPQAGYVIRTTDKLIWKGPRRSVEVNSAAHANFLGEQVGGGVKTSFGAGSRSIEILGARRVAKNREISVLDHSIHTLAPLIVTGSKRNNNRRVSDGSLRVDHNLAKFSGTTTMAGLSWSADCCYPTSGTLSFSLSNGATGGFSSDFATGTCGLVQMTFEDGTTKPVELSSCE